MSQKKRKKEFLFEDSDSCDDFSQGIPQATYRKYCRITPEIKEKLLFLILRNNLSIKQAARQLRMNYSSAKLIFNQYRDRQMQGNSNNKANNEEVFCHSRLLSGQEKSAVTIKYSVGGKLLGESKEFVSLSHLSNL